MIPQHWQPHHRSNDDELVGYLAPVDGVSRMTSVDEEGPVVAMTLVGTALGEVTGPGVARMALDAHGLDVLDARWWCRLPESLDRERLDAAEPEDAWEWRPVVIAESGTEECVVRLAYPGDDEAEASAVLPVPAAGLLRADQPDPEYA
ncbi:hypothetical protein [Agromyces sp. SYSU T00194]|uniref:hypothetical protein n=1 Tax=Agromyces chitinivorans TaxID=3158560 RepID=UPI0033929FB4